MEKALVIRKEDILGFVSAWRVSVTECLEYARRDMRSVATAKEYMEFISKKLEAMQSEIAEVHEYLLSPAKRMIFEPQPLTVADVTKELSSRTGVYVTLFSDDGVMVKNPMLIADDPTKAKDIDVSIMEEKTERSFDVTRKFLRIAYNDTELRRMIPKRATDVRLLVSDGKTAEYMEMKPKVVAA